MFTLAIEPGHRATQASCIHDDPLSNYISNIIMGGLSTQENAPRRLSKPRTNSSTTNLISTFSDHQTEATSSPLNSPDIDYFGDHAAVVSSQGERRSRRKSRSKIRAYLYGANEEAIQNSSEDDEGRGVLAGTARNVKKRLSRTGSSIMQLQSAKASSAHLSKSDSQGSDPEESAMLAVQIKEKAHNDRLAAQNHVSSPVDDKRHVDSVMAPVRRKSLYMPGIATRNASDILRKPPPSDALRSQTDRDYYYNPARPETSPLSQLAGLNLSEDGRATPSSINYPQLGGLLLGTLRVTNGIPRNDTPDLLGHSPTPELKTQEEYFTASEGSVAGNISATMTPSNLSPLQMQKELREIFKPDDDIVIPRQSSVVRHGRSDSATYMAHEYIAELGGSPFSEVPGSRQWSEHHSSLDAEATATPEAVVTGLGNWRQLIDDAGATSVGSCTTEEAFRKLNGHTQFTSETGRLSVHSSTTSRYSVSTETPKVDSGYSSNSSMYGAHLTLTASDHADRVGRTTSADLQRRPHDHSRPRGRRQSTSKERSYMPQITGPAPNSDSSNLTPRHALPAPYAGLPSSPSSQTVDTVRFSARSSARSSSQNLVRKLQKPRPKSQPPPVSCITVQRHRDPELANIPRVPSVIAARHADRLRQFPVLEHTFPSSQHTTVEERVSAGAIRPMPVRFPSPANALEAASSEICAFPATSDDRKASRPQALSGYRSSLMFDEDEYPQSAIVRSPSWSEFGGGRNKKERKKLAKEEKENEKRLLKEEKELAKRLEKNKKDLERQVKKDDGKQRATRSLSLSRTRAKSSDLPPSQQDTLFTIANFGTVAESLGRSPYDITTSMFSNPSQNAGSKHPHQIGASMPRSRSMVGMDETAAAESARARSRARSQSSGRPRPLSGGSYGEDDGIYGRRLRPHSMLINDVPPVPALAAVDIKAHDLEWARSRRRSQTFSGVKIETDGPFNDRAGLPGRSIRPSSIVVDVPPVPALPSIEQVKQREAQITRSRPQSMVLEASPTQTLTLPQIDHTEAQNDELSNSQSENLTPPCQPGVSKPVPRLWSKGSLEKKSPKAVDNLRIGRDSNDTSSNEDQSDKDSSIWDAQRRAWSQRRRSAGEALLKNRSSQDTVTQPRDSEGSKEHQQNNRPSFTRRLPSTEPRRLHESKQSSRPGPSPLAPSWKPPAPPPHISPQQQLYGPESSSSPYASKRPASYIEPITQHHPRPSPRPLPNTSSREPQAQEQTTSPTARLVQTYSSYALPRKRISSGNPPPNLKVEKLTGRYTGGLLYGYEPGCGLGGSAGTRSAKNEASRKSVDVSKGFGIDLSDVPIFVAPTSAK